MGSVWLRVACVAVPVAGLGLSGGCGRLGGGGGGLRVGFIGGCENSLIGKFAAGYVAGVPAARPDAVPSTRYLAGAEAPRPWFTEPPGLFEAARERGATAIGVNSDQYLTVDPRLRDVIITSMVKRVDNAVFGFVADVAHAHLTAGVRRFDVATGGVGYATSGGRIDGLVPEPEAYKEKIIDGSPVVPTNR